MRKFVARPGPLATSLTVFVAALIAYWRTLAPSVPTGDSGELITVAWVLGIAHPPGYPLFSMIGHLFTLLPFGSPAFRVNLMSALFAAGAASLTCACIYRVTDRNWAAGLVGGLSLAFSTAFWRYAVVAEVFSLNAFFGALILLLLLEWCRAPQQTWLLFAFGLSSGLASTNHQTIVLLAPACLVLVVSGARHVERGRVPRATAITAGFVIVGLLPYAYLPLAASADPPLNWGDPRTPIAMWRHLTRADYGTFSLVVSDQSMSGSALQHIGLFVRSIYDGFTPAGCLIVVAGAWWLWRHQRGVGLALLLAFLLSGPAFVAYARPPIENQIVLGVIERFYMLPSVFAAVALGLGVAQVAEWLGRFAPASFVLLVVPLAALVLHFAQVDQSTNFVERDFGTDMLRFAEPNALYILTGDAATNAVDYARLVEGQRPDMVVLNIEKLKLTSYVQQVRRQHAEIVLPFNAYAPGGNQMAELVQANWNARPVYLLGQLKDPGFDEEFDKERAGFAMKLLPKGSDPDAYTFIGNHLSLFEAAHYPPPSYPDTTFESSIVRAYGGLAFDVGYVLDDGVRDDQAIDYYRLALELDPSYAPANKNMGLLLYKRGESSAAAAVWQTYLRQMPDDPEAAQIRELLRQMGIS